jgi:hypothetical protein
MVSSHQQEKEEKEEKEEEEEEEEDLTTSGGDSSAHSFTNSAVCKHTWMMAISLIALASTTQKTPFLRSKPGPHHDRWSVGQLALVLSHIGGL